MKFPLVTVGDLTFRLLLLRPDWGTPPQITHRLDTLIGEGRTTIEERRPGRAAFLLSQRLTLAPQGNDADDWRKGLAALGDRLIALPLWVDALPVARWGERIYDAQQLINFDPDSGAYEILAGPTPAVDWVAAYPLLAPLLVGRWSTRPPATVLTEEDADVTVEITEARPWAWRIGVHAYGAGWTQTPNWLSPLRDVSEYGLELLQLPGAAAAPATDRTNAAARWRQEADFAFRSRLEIRTALTTFADKRGSWEAIAPLPAWFQPGAASAGTPDNYTARFASDKLSLTFDSLDYARARIGFLQEVSTPGRDQALAGEAYLYRLSYDPDPTQPELFTNWDAPLTTAEGDYQPAQVAHAEILRSLKPQEERAELQLAYVAGSYAADWISARLYGPLRLTIWKCDPADPAGTRGDPLFTGVVQEIRPDGNTLLLTASLFGKALDRRAPGWVFGPRCNTYVFSSLCGLAEAAHDSAGTITPADLSADGLTLTIHDVAGWGGPAYAANHFAYGTLRTGAGRSSMIATILTSAMVAGNLVVTLNRPLWADLVVVEGQAVTLLPGCGGQYVADCGTRFANQAKFRGFPFIPEYIESRAAGSPRAPRK